MTIRNETARATILNFLFSIARNSFTACLRKSENDQGGGAFWQFPGRFRPHHGRQSDDERSQTCWDGDVLAAIDCITNRRSGDARPGVEGPEFLAGPGIERKGLADHIPCKDQV